jgi:hypothetical protein
LLPLPAPRPADALLLALRALDASVVVHRVEAADAIVRALTDALYAEKLAGPAQVVLAKAAKPRPARAQEVAELYIPDAGPSAA